MLRLLVLIPAAGIGLAQISLTPIAGGNYGGPFRPSIRVAPGQIVPLQFQGVRLLDGDGYRFLTAPPGFPLVETLGSVTVLVSKGDFAASPRRFEPIPILALEQWSSLCNISPQSDGCLVGVAFVQMPYDIPPEPSPTSPAALRPSLIKIRFGATETAELRLLVDAIRPRIARSCDLPPGRREVCDSDLVTTVGGKLLRTKNNYFSGMDLRSGETMVIYAYGLGRTDPEAVAGRETTRPMAIRAPLQVRFEWLEHNGGAMETINSEPQYAGLTPGTAGLYQINVAIPEMPAAVERCTDNVRSNLRVSISAPAASLIEAVEICVLPKQ